MEALASEVREHGLVVLAGAGISMLAPSSLPGWWDFNEAVLEALADRLVRFTSRPWAEERLARLLERRRTLHAFTPDFMAQLMEAEVGDDYFRVLQALDADAWNANHAALAALAAAGALRAVVTTNFDRLIERALETQGIPFRVFARPDDFDALEDALATPGAAIPIIKAHGSVEHPDSMVDTLAQRVAGRPRALEDGIARLLQRHACLILGFSGADLAYDPDYLGLRRAIPGLRGLTALVRTGTTPLAAMRALIEDSGARTVEGELPDALGRLCAALDVRPAPVPAQETPDWKALLRDRTRAWIDALGTMPALNMFVSLVDANADDDGVLDFLVFFRRYYRTEQDTVDPWHGTPSYWRYEYNFGRRLLDRGRISPAFHDLDEGRHLLASERLALRPYEDALNLLGNAAQRGGLLEAKCALSELVLLLYGPGRALAHAMQVIGAVVEKGSRRTAVEAAVMAAHIAELALEYQVAAQWLDAAHAEARIAGDEPGRAAAALCTARVAACRGRHDDAAAALARAAAVADRLALHTLRAHTDAAHGMLLSLQDRDADAIEPLQRACAWYRHHERQPRLFLTLLDLIRAGHYSGRPDVASEAYDGLRTLAPRYPGLQGLLFLVEAELTLFDGDLDTAAGVAADLRAFAERDGDFPWNRGLDRADRFDARIAEARAT